MGFLEGFASFLGGMAGRAKELVELANEYKSEYEYMSDHELIEEYRHWKTKSGREAQARVMAIRSILKSRGIE